MLIKSTREMKVEELFWGYRHSNKKIGSEFTFQFCQRLLMKLHITYLYLCLLSAV